MKSSLQPEGAGLCLRDTIRQLKAINKILVKTIFPILALLCLYGNSYGQIRYDYRKVSEPFFIDSWINQNVPLGKVINYCDTTATLNDFKGKLIILDFWFTHCGSCIAQFPKEDSLQKAFNKDIQFILVTFDSEKTVKDFFVKWKAKTGIGLSMPMIVEDTLLKKAFRHYYDPHYVWILPDGKVIGQTAAQFVTKDNIEGLLKEWSKRKALYEKINAYQKAHPAIPLKKN